MKHAGDVVYFFGAGATRADFPDAPLGDQLLHNILSDEPADSPVRSFLREVFPESMLAPGASADLRPRLDDVFTLIDAHLAGRAPSPTKQSVQLLRAVRQRIVAAMGASLGNTLGDSHGALAGRFAKILARTPAVVISTNYDTVLDNALYSSDSVNYGVQVRFQLSGGGVRPGRNMIAGRAVYTLRPDTSIPHDVVPLLKLHGSLNWLYCSRCDELDVTLAKAGALDILSDPTTGMCKRQYCTARYEAILTGPSLEQRYDHRVLNETWNLAEQALAEATKLVLVGYSLPEADYLIRSMLARTFSSRSKSVLAITDKKSGPEEEAFEARHRKLFPDFEYEAYGFQGLVERLEKSEAGRP